MFFWALHHVDWSVDRCQHLTGTYYLHLQGSSDDAGNQRDYIGWKGKYHHENLVSHKIKFAIKFSQAASHVTWLKADETNVSRTIFVLVLRELKTAGSPSHHESFKSYKIELL
jgi:hypothetical protein